MDSLLDFLANYYVVFMIISGVLLLALIGFIVTGKKKKTEGVQTADPMAQQMTAPNAEMPVTPTPAPEMNSATVIPESTQPTLADVATPVEPVTPVPNAPVEAVATPDANSVVESNTVPMEPIAPANSDEPTLIIEDKSAVPQEAATLFETPNEAANTQPAVETPATPETVQPVTPDTTSPAETSTSVPTEPVTPSTPADMTQSTPTEVVTPESAPAAPDVQPATPTASIFENQ